MLKEKLNVFLLTWWCFNVTDTSSSKTPRTDKKTKISVDLPTGKSHTWTSTYFDFDAMWFITVTNALVAGCNGGNSPAVFVTHFCLVAQWWMKGALCLLPYFRYTFCDLLCSMSMRHVFWVFKKAWLAGGFPATANGAYTTNQIAFPVHAGWLGRR